jgi:hypothetical protein
MVTWDVEAAAAMDSLKGLQTTAGGFEDIGGRFSDALTNAAANSSMSGKGGKIAIALGEFMEHWKDALPGMVKHTNDVLQGTANALSAMANGQQEMALEAQRGIQQTDGVSPTAVIAAAAASTRPAAPRNAV